MMSVIEKSIICFTTGHRVAILRDVFVLYLILVQIIDYFIVRDYMYIPLFHLFKMKNFEKFLKAAYSVTLNIFEKCSFLFKSIVKIELRYVSTINMFSTAENCMEK